MKNAKHIIFGMVLTYTITLLVMVILQVVYADTTIELPLNDLIGQVGILTSIYIAGDMSAVIVSSAAKKPGDSTKVEKFKQYLIVTVLWFGIAIAMNGIYLYTLNELFQPNAAWVNASATAIVFAGTLKGNKVAGAAHSGKLSDILSKFNTTEDVEVTTAADAIAEGEMCNDTPERDD